MMRKLWLVLLVAAATGAQAQDATGVVKLNPWGAIVGQYQLGYEHFISERTSIQLTPGAVFSSVSLLAANDTLVTAGSVGAKRSGIILIPEVRYYLGDNAPTGVYAAVFGRYRDVTTTLDDDPASTQTRSAVGGGFVLGYQHKLANGLVGDIFIGPQFKQTDTRSTGNFDDYAFTLEEASDTGIRFGINIGFGF